LGERSSAGSSAASREATPRARLSSQPVISPSSAASSSPAPGPGDGTRPSSAPRRRWLRGSLLSAPGDGSAPPLLPGGGGARLSSAPGHGDATTTTQGLCEQEDDEGTNFGARRSREGE
jgi:hypothetical protein